MTKPRNTSKKIFKKHDELRAILTDTLPVEVPAILSNFHVHSNLHRLFPPPFRKSHFQHHVRADAQTGEELVAWLIARHIDPIKQDLHERPYSIDIVTTENKRRVISLPHLRSQLRNALFVAKQADKIIYYTSLSDISARSPAGVAKDTVPVPSKRGMSPAFKIDSQELDPIEANPKSWAKHFFIYRGYTRLYRLVQSALFSKLEERYPVLLMLDVQSTFPSLYTHSISWAIRGVNHSKSFSSPTTSKQLEQRNEIFGDEFDKITQQSNWRETNGVIVGPEVSRIFAEIIFQRIDIEITLEANKILNVGSGVSPGTKYKILRYVDDYFVFAQSKHIAFTVKNSISRSLDNFHLTLNDSKEQLLDRPFLSAQGRLSLHTSEFLSESLKSFSEICEAGSDISIQALTRNLARWKRNIRDKIRLSCKESNDDASIISSRVPAAMRDRAYEIYTRQGKSDAQSAERTAEAVWALVDVNGYLLSLRKTEAAVTAFCLSALCCLRLNETAGGVVRRIGQMERLFERCKEIAQGMAIEFDHNTSDQHHDRRGNLSLCNVISCLSEFPLPFHLSETEIHELLKFDPASFDERQYFELITCLHYNYKTRQRYQKSREVLARLRMLVRGSKLVHAGISFGILDTLSCPLFTVDERRKLLNDILPELNISQQGISKLVKNSAIEFFEANPWQVNWNSTIQLEEMFYRKTIEQTYD